MLQSLRAQLPHSTRLCLHLPRGRVSLWRRTLTDYQAKYAEKLGKIAQERGVSVEDLHAHVQRQQRAIEAESQSAERARKEEDIQTTSASQVRLPPRPSVRKDSPPIKPLSAILNTERLLSKPHTTEQVSALWTAFHASRSGRTALRSVTPNSSFPSLARRP